MPANSEKLHTFQWPKTWWLAFFLPESKYSIHSDVKEKKHIFTYEKLKRAECLLFIIDKFLKLLRNPLNELTEFTVEPVVSVTPICIFHHVVSQVEFKYTHIFAICVLNYGRSLPVSGGWRGASGSLNPPPSGRWSPAGWGSSGCCSSGHRCMQGRNSTSGPETRHKHPPRFRWKKLIFI